MSKSIYVIGGMGLAGCLLLSFLMQHLLKVRGDRAASPVALELQELFSGRLARPVQVAVIEEQGIRTMVVRMALLEGDPRQVVRGAGGLAWRRAAVLPQPPQRLRLEVTGSDPAEAPAVVEFSSRGVGAAPPPSRAAAEKARGGEPVGPRQPPVPQIAPVEAPALPPAPAGGR